MGRFLLTAMPFTGHVAPLTAVARQLVERGHDVRFYTGSRFRARVEASGARPVPWREAPDFDEYDIEATFPRLVGKKGMRQLFVNVIDCFIGTAPAQVADLTAEWEHEPWDVLATGKDQAAFDAAERVVADLEAAGYDVVYDDRPKLSPGVKFADAELIGVPKIVIAGRGVADGLVEVWDRASGDRVAVPIDGVVAALAG